MCCPGSWKEWTSRKRDRWVSWARCCRKVKYKETREWTAECANLAALGKSLPGGVEWGRPSGMMEKKSCRGKDNLQLLQGILLRS